MSDLWKVALAAAVIVIAARRVVPMVPVVGPVAAPWVA